MADDYKPESVRAARDDAEGARTAMNVARQEMDREWSSLPPEFKQSDLGKDLATERVALENDIDAMNAAWGPLANFNLPSPVPGLRSVGTFRQVEAQHRNVVKSIQRWKLRVAAYRDLVQALPTLILRQIHQRLVVTLPMGSTAAPGARDGSGGPSRADTPFVPLSRREPRVSVRAPGVDREPNERAQKAKAPNPAPARSTNPGSSGFAGASSDALGLASETRGIGNLGGGDADPSGGAVVAVRELGGGIIDKSQERAVGVARGTDKSAEGRSQIGVDNSSLSFVDATTGKTISTYQYASEPSAAEQLAEDSTAEDEKESADQSAEASPHQKRGGGGSMPNPEDSGGGGEGPRTSPADAPNPETTGRFGSGDLRIPARLRFSAMPNPESRGASVAGVGDFSGDEDGRDPSAPLIGRTFDPRTFRYRVPGAFGDRPSDDGNTSTGGGLAGPRAYDAYPDPESSGGVGPKARYERPNPEDSGSPHGPSARTAISWSSSTRNRMV
jgi:hypothetical protein